MKKKKKKKKLKLELEKETVANINIEKPQGDKGQNKPAHTRTTTAPTEDREE